jgi:hypothetical protein
MRLRPRRLRVKRLDGRCLHLTQSAREKPHILKREKCFWLSRALRDLKKNAHFSPLCCSLTSLQFFLSSSGVVKRSLNKKPTSSDNANNPWAPLLPADLSRLSFSFINRARAHHLTRWKNRILGVIRAEKMKKCFAVND